MADITDPAALTLLDGTTPTADEVNRKVYYPSHDGSELGEVNGLLDYTNIDAAVDFQRRHIQRGAWSQGEGFGATANVDFFGDLLFPNFGGGKADARLDTGSWTTSDQDTFGADELPYITIPGMSVVVPNPHTSASWIKVTWRVGYVVGPGLFVRGSNGKYGAEEPESRYGTGSTTIPNSQFVRGKDAGVLRLFCNGVPHPYILKRIPEGRTTTVPSDDYKESPENNLLRYSDFQWWEGSAVIGSTEAGDWTGLSVDPTDRGYYTFSIRAFSRHRCLRFKVRGMEYTVQR